MRTRQVASLWSTAWRSLIKSGVYWKFAAADIVIAGAAVAVTWPGAIMFDAPALPVTLSALFYAHGAVLAYAAISLAGENFAHEGDYGSIDWVYYGVATPAEVVLGRVLWVLSVLASLTALVFPFAVAAYHLYPIPGTALAGALFALATALLCFTAIGQVIGASIAERSIRAIAADGFFTLSAILIFLASGWFGEPGQTRTLIYNPLGAIHYFLSAPAPGAPAFPWSTWLIAYGVVLAVIFAFAYRKLWEWAPPPDWGPRPRPTGRYRPKGQRKSTANARSGAPPADGGDGL